MGVRSEGKGGLPFSNSRLQGVIRKSLCVRSSPTRLTLKRGTPKQPSPRSTLTVSPTPTPYPELKRRDPDARRTTGQEATGRSRDRVTLLRTPSDNK